MELPHFHVNITKHIPCIYNPIIIIICAIIYCWSENIYEYINCSGIEPKNSYAMSGFNTGGWYSKYTS